MKTNARGDGTDATRVDDVVGKETLLTHARMCARAAYGDERGCERWMTLRDGAAALACARGAFPESFDAVVVRPAAGGRDEVTCARAAAKRPWEAVRAIFARERVPTNATSVEAMARGDFGATFDAMAMMYWVFTLRRSALEGDGMVSISFAHRLGPGTLAYCSSEETRERAVRLAKRSTKTQNKSRDSRRASVSSEDGKNSSSASLKEEPAQSPVIRELAEAGSQALEEEKNTEPSALGAAAAPTKSLTIDDWETLTELRWELEKTKILLEDRDREIERLRAAHSPRNSHAQQAQIREMLKQLAEESAERIRVTRAYDQLCEELKMMRVEISGLMSATILSPRNMEVFSTVDVSTDAGRATAQVMIDAMDRVRKADADVQMERVDEGGGILSPITNETESSLSPSFMSRLDAFELSESSARRQDQSQVHGASDDENATVDPNEIHRSESRESLSLYDSLSSAA